MLKNVIGLTTLLLLAGLFQSATLPANVVETTSTECISNTSSKAGATLLVMSIGATKKKLVVTGINDECRTTQYLWSTGARTRSIVIEGSGTYSVYVKDCDDCSFCWQELIETIVW